MAERKPILCLDFDGVCHSYSSGWKGADIIPDRPVDGLFDFVSMVQGDFDVQIFSTRSKTEQGRDAMRAWFELHIAAWQRKNKTEEGRIPYIEMVSFPEDKPPAMIGIDDRVKTFTGKFPSVRELLGFKTWQGK